MTTGIYYVAAGRDRTPKVQSPPPPSDIDLTWFDSFIEEYHAPATYTGDPEWGGNPTSHADQMAIYRQVFESLQGVPWRDGLLYYDPTATAVHAYHYKQARGQGTDSRWLDYATDAGTFWWLANQRNQYTAATGVYHFPAGLWLCQDLGIVLSQSEFIAACDNAIRTFYGSIYYNNASTHERQVRESGRLFEWLLYMYRETGQSDPWYQNADVHHGSRYHNGQFYQERHFWEWLREWTEAPVYPRFGGGSFTDPWDYMALGIDPANQFGLAIFMMGPFMCQFGSQANMQLWNEDANYKQDSRRDFVLEMVDYNRANGWFPASGVPGNLDEFGSYGYYYCLCGPDDGVRVAHDYCGTGGTNDYWGRRLYATRELTPFHLEQLAWAWRITGDQKYADWFSEVWTSMQDWYNSGLYSIWMRDYRNGKQVNQLCLRVFNALVARGVISFKCAGYPDGAWPYPTPPAVNPNP